MKDISEKSILIQKIIRVLKISEQDYSFLEKLEVEELSVLNDGIQDALFNNQSEHWKRVADVAKYLPNYMNAKVSEKVLGAYITANLSYHLDSKDLVGISKFLSKPFLAEVAENLIPSKSDKLVNELPISLVQSVTEYLMSKEQYFVIASFIEVVHRKRLMQLIDAINSDSDLLKTSEYIRNPELLKDIFLSFSPSRQTKLLQKSIEIRKQGVIIKTLMQIPTKERKRIIDQFVATNPTGAVAFVERLS